MLKTGKRTLHRPPNHNNTYRPDFIPQEVEIIGWISNKWNRAVGWQISEISEHTKGWLKSKGVETTNIFRIWSEKTQSTTLVKIRTKTGTWSHMDGDYLLENNAIQWNRFTPFTKCLID